MRQGDVVHFLHTDHLGSTSLTTGATGAPIAQTRYRPYGEERWTDGETPTDFTFTGQRADSYMELIEMGARLYDPQLGRWLSPDSIIPDLTNPQSLNRYSYVYNNSMRYTDPSGHCIFGLDTAVCIAVAVGLVLTGVLLEVNASNPLPASEVPSAEQGLAGLMFMAGGGAVALAPELVATGGIAAGADGDYTNEAQNLANVVQTATNAVQSNQAVIADTDVVMGKLVEAGQAFVTPQTMAELEVLGRTSTAQGFSQISAEVQPGFAQAQAFFNQLVPNAQGKAGDVYNLATTAMNNGTLLTADKSTVFTPLVNAVQNGLVTGQALTNQVIVKVPEIGEVTVKLLEHK